LCCFNHKLALVTSGECVTLITH